MKEINLRSGIELLRKIRRLKKRMKDKDKTKNYGNVSIFFTPDIVA